MPRPSIFNQYVVPPGRRKGPRRYRPLRLERVESRLLLAADPAISEEEAIFLATGESPSPPPIGANDFRISDMGGDDSFAAFDAAVAYNSTANEYLVVWAGDDTADEEFEIHGQRINAATGAQVGTNDFRISEGGVLFQAVRPAVAYNSTANEYLVVWEGDDDVNDEFGIFGQRLSAAGAQLGVNDFGISELTLGDVEDPAVAHDATHNQYLVVWSGDEGTVLGIEEFEIFGQRLNAAGAAIGVNDFSISQMGPDGNRDFGAFLPAVAYNGTNDQFLAVWTGSDDAGSLVAEEFEIYGQRLSAANGAAVGTNDFRISDMGLDGNANFDAINPAVAYNSAANQYLVVWEGDDNTAPLVDNEFEIFGQRLSAATGAAVGANDFRISDMGPNGSGSFFAATPSVTYNSSDNQYLVLWRGDDNTAPLVDNEFEIFGQRLSAAGAALGANDFRVSDMGPNGDLNFGASFFAPSVAYNSANNQYLVAWDGNDNTPPLTVDEFEVFGQRLSGAGAAVGVNDFRISDMGGDALFDGLQPAVAYNSTANEYLVVWEGDDQVDDEFEIYGQRINAATGAAVGANDFRISNMGPDGSSGFGAFQVAVAYNSTNNQYLVVWAGDDNTAPLVDEEFEIFGQRLNAAGAQIGTDDFRISDMGSNGDTSFQAFRPAVAYNSTNNQYLVTWVGEDDAGALVDNEFEIYGQRINAATGAALGANDFRISDMGTDGNTAFGVGDPAVEYNSTNNQYLVVWVGDDNTAPLVDNEPEIFGQRINAATGAAVGANDFRISDMGANGNTAIGAFQPDAAYNSTNNEYLVVWNGDDDTGALTDEEFEVYGQRLSAAGSPLGTNDFRISDMGPDGNPAFGAFQPAVTHNTAANEYLVVWEGDDNIAPLVNDEFEIFGQRISNAGAALGANDFRISDMGPNGNATFGAFDTVVAYNSADNQYLAVWIGDDNANFQIDNEFEVFGQRLSHPASAAPAAQSEASEVPSQTAAANQPESSPGSETPARRDNEGTLMLGGFIITTQRFSTSITSTARKSSRLEELDAFFQRLGGSESRDN